MDVLHMDCKGTFHKMCFGVVHGYGKDDAKMTLHVKLPYLPDGKDIIEDVLWMLPYGGKEYGFLHRPEIGDIVVLLFFGTYKQQAIAIGCLNEKDCSLYQDVSDKNEKKIWKSKGGVSAEIWDEKDKEHLQFTCPGFMFLMSESEKSIFLQDEEGNNKVVLQKDDGKINIQAAKELRLSCGKSTMIMKEDGTITLQGQEVSIQGSKLSLNGKESIDIKGTDLKMIGTSKLEANGKGNVKLGSSGVMEINGGIIKLG